MKMIQAGTHDVRSFPFIMADLVPYSLLQWYLPGITEYRVKTARQHTVQHGCGSAVLISIESFRGSGQGFADVARGK